MSDPIESAARELSSFCFNKGPTINPLPTDEALAILRKHFAQQWQDISTAPKDGTEFLCFYSGYCDIASMQCNFIRRVRDSVILWPTHWMPLPPPPEEQR
jgi:hypothetical protein